MYHIKSDKRSQTSAEVIVQGFLECLQTTPLRSITVTDIHRVTGISRATIYRLFDTPEDILYYHFDHLQEQSSELLLSAADKSFRDPMMLAVEMGMQHYNLLNALVDSGRFDLLYLYTEQSFRSTNPTFSLFPPDADQRTQEYIMNQFSMAMVGAMISWDRNGRKETAAELTQFLRKFYKFMGEVLERENNNFG